MPQSSIAALTIASTKQEKKALQPEIRSQPINLNAVLKAKKKESVK